MKIESLSFGLSAFAGVWGGGRGFFRGGRGRQQRGKVIDLLKVNKRSKRGSEKEGVNLMAK